VDTNLTPKGGIYDWRKKKSAKEITPPLLLGILGLGGVLAIYLSVPGFRPIELVLLITVGFAAWGYTQNIVRGITTIVILYIATGVAAVFYRAAVPYTAVIKMVITLPLTRHFSTHPPMDNGTLAFSFGLLTVLVWVVLEIAVRVSFHDVSVPALSILDNLGGTFVYLIVGILVASLLFNALGYGRLRPMHDRARLRPVFNKVVYVHYVTQSFWFNRPPAIYAYDLKLRGH